MSHALIVGAGFSGKIVGNWLSKHGQVVFGTTRSPAAFDTLQQHGIEPRLFDGDEIDHDLIKTLANITHLIVSIAPPRSKKDAINKTHTDIFLAALQGKSLTTMAPKLRWVGYLSTVGVYGNHDGAWIDENTEIAPVSERSHQRAIAENEWQTWSKLHNLPLAIFRLSGIYGPGRNALVTVANGKSRRLVKPGQVFNRIHVDDIAQAVHRAGERLAEGVFNITDDEPAPPQDVITFAHQLMGTEPPEAMNFETADLTPMARSFYGENKRVSNQKSKDILNMRYAWPDYRTSLQKMCNDDLWM